MYRKQIKDMSAQGIKPKVIAQALGCCIETVYRTRSKLNNRTLESRTKLYQRWVRHSDRGKRFGWQEFKDWLATKTHCYITGRKIDYSQPETWHLDHIVPKSKGGTLGLDNLAVCCAHANFAKWDMALEDLHILCQEILEHAGYSITPPQ